MNFKMIVFLLSCLITTQISVTAPTCGTKAHIAQWIARLKKRNSLSQAERAKLVTKVKQFVNAVKQAKTQRLIVGSKVQPKAVEQIGAAFEKSFECTNGKAFINHMIKEEPLLFGLLDQFNESTALDDLEIVMDVLQDSAIDARRNEL